MLSEFPIPSQSASTRRLVCWHTVWNERGAPIQVAGYWRAGSAGVRYVVTCFRTRGRLVARGRAGERDEGNVARTLDRNRQRSLVPGAGAELPPGLDLAPFADMATQASDVLVVNVTDVVNAEGADLPARGVPSSAGTSSTAATGSAGSTWTAPVAITITLATLTLRTTEAGSLRSALLRGSCARTAAFPVFPILIVCHELCSLACLVPALGMNPGTRTGCRPCHWGGSH